MLCAQKQRGNRQNAAAAAEVQHLFAALNGALKLFHAHLRRSVRAGAEDHAGVQQHLHAMLGVFRVQPLRHDQKLRADLERLIVLLPVVLPVLVLHMLQRDIKRSKFDGRILLRKQPQLIFEIGDRLRCGRGVFEVEPDLAQALHLFFQTLVHIVPVLLVVFQKLVKLVLIVHNKAVEAEHRQPLSDKLDCLRRGFDANFNPLHDKPP